MIPKIELRIGNWVMNEGNYFQIMSGAAIDAAENYLPIEINEAILEKCGFGFWDYFKLWQKKEDLPKTGFLLEMDRNYNVRDFGQRDIGVRLTTLHQLQNLLYQLKGVEIDVDFPGIENSGNKPLNTAGILLDAASKN
jgi:hypothetical protein